MKLSKDQKRIIKFMLMYTGIFIVVFSLIPLVAGRHLTWGDFFTFAGIAILACGLAGLIYVIGSKIPKKDK